MGRGKLLGLCGLLGDGPRALGWQQPVYWNSGNTQHGYPLGTCGHLLASHQGAHLPDLLGCLALALHLCVGGSVSCVDM